MFSKKDIDELMAAGFLMVQKHPEADLFIYNYTAKAQYERLWNDITLQSRGLILDPGMNVVARPFPKFFNLGEHENQLIPDEPFEVFEKLDGSLGILYWLGDRPFIATRGSFTSDQSVKANEILNKKYGHLLHKLDRSKTYLFEIIYPENRIVVDYGDMQDILLLTVIDTETGREEEPEDIGLPMVKRYHSIKDLEALKTLEETNKEGFVIRFSSGLRYKVKFAEYVRIHRIITQVSTISIWEYLRSGQNLDELLDRVPDEFYNWVKKTNTDLLSAFKEIEQKARGDFRVLDSRKDTALYFQQCAYPKVMFDMLDKRNYNDTIWKMLRPKFSKPFANFEE